MDQVQSPAGDLEAIAKAIAALRPEEKQRLFRLLAEQGDLPSLSVGQAFQPVSEGVGCPLAPAPNGPHLFSSLSSSWANPSLVTEPMKWRTRRPS